MKRFVSLAGCALPLQRGEESTPEPPRTAERTDDVAWGEKPAPAPEQQPKSSDTREPADTPTEEPEIARTVEDYLPMTPDLVYVYEGIGMGQVGFEAYVEYIDDYGMGIQHRHITDGVENIVVTRLEDNALERYMSDEPTTYRQHMIWAGLESLGPILEGPIEVGHQWLGAGDLLSTIVSLNAEADGRTGLLHVRSTTPSGYGAVHTYYGPGVGMVKDVYETDDGEEIGTRLVEVRENEPYVQRVLLYNPDLAGVLHSTVLPSLFWTGDEPDVVLEAMMREAPRDGLLPTIGPETRINVLFNDSGIIYADFSADFATALGLDEAMEAQRLRAVVNTITEYYGENTVHLTVAGEPYEFGDVRFMPGEVHVRDMDGVM